MSNVLSKVVPPSVPEVGLKLTEQQQLVVEAITVAGLTDVQDLARHADCHPKNIYKILKKEHVRKAILESVSGTLLASAPKAMATSIKLLSSKSDYVRHQAASDLLNRNDIGVSNGIIGQAVNVKIDLS